MRGSLGLGSLGLGCPCRRLRWPWLVPIAFALAAAQLLAFAIDWSEAVWWLALPVASMWMGCCCSSGCCCPDPMPTTLVFTFTSAHAAGCSGGFGNCNPLIGQEIELVKTDIRTWEGTETLSCSPYGTLTLKIKLECLPAVCPPGFGGTPVWRLTITALAGTCESLPGFAGADPITGDCVLGDNITTDAVCCPFNAPFTVCIEPQGGDCCCNGTQSVCVLNAEVFDPNPPDPCP